MRWLITGASGQLGAYLLRELRHRGERDVLGWTHHTTGELFGFPLEPVPLEDPDRLIAAWQQFQPEIVVHAAALSRVEECYGDPRRAFRVNVVATGQLAQCAMQHQSRFLYVSTDLVFDGTEGDYYEGDDPRPLSVYGSTKLAGETCAEQCPNAVIVRLSLLFGPGLGRQPTFFDRQVQSLRAGKRLTLFDDEYRTPLYLETAAAALVEIARSDVTGVWHVAGMERLSRYEMGLRLAMQLGADLRLLEASSSEGRFSEPRPRDVSLDITQFLSRFSDFKIPDYSESIERALNLMSDLPGRGAIS